MTPTELYTAYAAYCDLVTREVWAGAAYSGEHQPAAWLHIVSVQQFASLHLTRLADGPPLLQKIARQNLEALHKSLTHSHTQSAHT